MKDTITVGKRSTVAKGKTRTYLEAKIGEPHLLSIGADQGDQLRVKRRGKSLIVTKE